MAVNSSENYSNTSVSFLLGMSVIATKFFLALPLSLLVLCLGLRRWWQQGSLTMRSHSNVFTYHTAVVELFYALGAFLFFCSFYFGLTDGMNIALYLCAITFPGETSFHILTCIDRYLAVVYPVIYQGLRRSKGVQIRNISIGCTWLLCFGWIWARGQFGSIPSILYVIILLLSLVVVSFCSLSVLWVLNRPGPGELSRDRAQGNHMKRTAFFTITAILVVLWLYFLGYLVSFALVGLDLLCTADARLMGQMSSYIFTLPSSLVLPTLFLKRAGKPVC